MVEFRLVPYAESTFLLLAALSLGALAASRPWLAALFAALATATRMVGLALVAAIAFELWRTRPRSWTALLAPILGLAGIGSFALYLGLSFGDPLAFYHAIDQPAWRRSPLAAPLVLLLAPFKSAYHLLSGRGAIGDLDVFWLAGALALLWLERRRLPPAWLVYALVGLALPVGSGSLGSIGRYIVPLFPVTAALALRLEGRRRGEIALVVVGFAGMQVLIAARYARWLWES